MIAHLWAQMWPNVFSPSVWTLVGLTLSHVLHGQRLKRLETKFHDRQHGDRQHPG